MAAPKNAVQGEAITPADPHPESQAGSSSPPPPERKEYGVDTKIPLLTWRSLVLATFVSLGGILFGYDTGQISGFLQMSNYQKRYGQLNAQGEYTFSDVRSGLLVGLLSIGTLIGSLCGAPTADLLGRKYSISFWCLIMIIGLIVQISSPAGNWVQMIVARWVTGLGVGGCSLLVPMYQGESSPRHIRGAVICCYQLFITLGIFLSYCINLGTHHIKGSTAQWRITLGITFLFAIALGVGMIFFPESPRYDFRKGRVDQARRTLAGLYGIPENHKRIIQELDEIREQLDAESQEQRWHEFITGPKMFYRLLLGMVLQSLQQLSGANYFFYYGTTIFKGAGLNDSFITQTILGAVNFGTTFGGLYIVENFGRRKSLMAGGMLIFIWFMVFSSIGHFVLDVDHPQNTPGAGKAMIVIGCLFVATYVSCLLPSTKFSF